MRLNDEVKPHRRTQIKGCDNSWIVFKANLLDNNIVSFMLTRFLPNMESDSWLMVAVHFTDAKPQLPFMNSSWGMHSFTLDKLPRAIVFKETRAN
ncbi:hypothetical protein NPIL_616631 [Nephila pilipes]|uniref:Uncharacterized protein n=1 Tax=Nephila pilipes TaxID=299642 RepID=A0A8X6P8C0_NEPPI|nr:hypothetical protein NPIL_616631 [Nephila pilipes]